jgi:hypothetical protein
MDVDPRSDGSKEQSATSNESEANETRSLLRKRVSGVGAPQVKGLLQKPRSATGGEARFQVSTQYTDFSDMQPKYGPCGKKFLRFLLDAIGASAGRGAHEARRSGCTRGLDRLDGILGRVLGASRKGGEISLGGARSVPATAKIKSTARRSVPATLRNGTSSVPAADSAQQLLRCGLHALELTDFRTPRLIQVVRHIPQGVPRRTLLRQGQPLPAPNKIPEYRTEFLDCNKNFVE